MLNHIWIAFFLASFLSALFQCFVVGNTAIWTEVINSTFTTSEKAFQIALGLTGILCLWLGLLKIAERCGITNLISKLLAPLFKKIMPDVPSDHPAIGNMIMNISANILGLDNAATPAGIKAMEELQKLNKEKDTATNSQIMFMVLNTSSVTILPIAILMYRAEMGSANPAAVFIPILLATSASTFVGFLSVCLLQRINIFNRVVLSYVGGFILALIGIVYYFSNLPEEARTVQSAAIGNFILFFIMICFIFVGWIKKLPVYEIFIEGAKGGFSVAMRLIPYIVAMLVSISLLRSSGVLDLLLDGLTWLVSLTGMDTSFIPAIPTAIMKPLSGSGARGMMLETMQNYGADSFPAFIASTIQGSTETTFYVLAVYFGAVKITKVRHAIGCSLLADVAGIIAAIYLGYYFY